MKKYHKRLWLNPDPSHFTGSLTAMCNPDETYLRIGDCLRSVHIHPDHTHGGRRKREVYKRRHRRDFITKLRLLAREITEFADWLERHWVNKK